MLDMSKEQVKDILNNKKIIQDDKDNKKIRLVRSSLASEILHDLKVENMILKVLLVVSILANIFILLFKV